MNGFDLLKAVTDLVTALLLQAKVKHAGNCLAMSQVVKDFLILFEIETKLINVKVLEDGQKINHYCLEMKDGKIIDPTASQFKEMPKVFIGKMPENYLNKRYVPAKEIQ